VVDKSIVEKGYNAQTPTARHFDGRTTITVPDIDVSTRKQNPVVPFPLFPFFATFVIC
jgi:hypothetical protein